MKANLHSPRCFKIDSRSELETLIPFENSKALRLAEKNITSWHTQSFHTVFLIDSRGHRINLLLSTSISDWIQTNRLPSLSGSLVIV